MATGRSGIHTICTACIVSLTEQLWSKISRVPRKHCRLDIIRFSQNNSHTNIHKLGMIVKLTYKARVHVYYSPPMTTATSLVR